MRYGELISDAFRITWRNRYLWFFGIFAGTPSFNFQGNFSSGSDTGSLDVDPAVIIAVAAVALVLVLVYVVLGTVAQGGLTDSVAAIARGEGRRFRTTWRAGWSRFWRVLGYGALVALVGLGLFLAVALPLAALVIAGFVLTDSVGVHVLLLVPAGLAALVLLFVVFLPFPVVAQLGLRARVLDGAGALESLRRGWRLFRGNIGKSLLLVLIQVGISTGVGIGFVLIIFALALPTIVLAFALAAFGALGSFQHAFWTLAYLRLAWLTP